MPPDEGHTNPEPAQRLDEQIHELFAHLSAQIASVGDDARAAADTVRDMRVEQRAYQRATDARLKRLERQAFGTSNPPPADGGEKPLATEVSEQRRQITEHDGELATLAGQVIATRAELAEVRAITAAQSKAFGLARPEEALSKKAAAFLFSREGAKAFVAIVTALAALAGAMRGAEALREVPAREVHR